jgi:hypothetical protein
MDTMDLKNELPKLLPKAIEWAQDQEERARKTGISLPSGFVEVARRVGVNEPELVRLKIVDWLPQPDDPVLKAAADETGLLSPIMTGLTLGYAVFIIAGNEHIRLISHECRHVYQYEIYGGISGFLPIYLAQVVEHGYQNAPFEMDARNHEID